VERAAGISVVQSVFAFWRATITLLPLLSDRMPAQRYGVCLQQIGTAVQLNAPRGLTDDNQVSLHIQGQCRLWPETPSDGAYDRDYREDHGDDKR
jgi:hypothetical protein